MGEFADSVKARIKVAKADMKFVAAESIQDVVRAAQTTQLGITRGATSFEEGKIPVGETSDLVNSLASSVNGSSSGQGAASYETAILSFEIGDTLQFEWPVEHAMRMEYGFTGTDKLGRKYNQPGRHFVGANVARFPEFVEKRVAEVKRK